MGQYLVNMWVYAVIVDFEELLTRSHRFPERVGRVTIDGIVDAEDWACMICLRYRILMGYSHDYTVVPPWLTVTNELNTTEKSYDWFFNACSEVPS